MFNKFFSISLAVLLSIGTLYADETKSYGGGSVQGAGTTSPKDAPEPPVFGPYDTGGKINYHDFDLSDHSRSSAGIRSLLVPGWGQFFNGEERKGTLLFSVTAILAVSAFSTYNNAQNSYDDYRSTGRKDSSTYNDYSSKLNLSIILTGLTAVMWGVSVHDATKNYQKAESNAGTTLAFNASGNPELVYQRKF
jgi:hypothetical protein